MDITPILKTGKKENLGNCRSVSLHSVSGRMMEQIILETITKYMKGKKVVRSGQC